MCFLDRAYVALYNLPMWDTVSVENLLRSHADEKYREFHGGLTKTAYERVGVRVPVLRSMAKDIIKSGEWREFLAARPVRLYEHAMLLGVVSASVKEPYEDKIERLERFSRLVDDWAVCDITCSSLRCKDERLFGDMARFAGSGDVWLARIGLVVLLGNYADGEHVDGLREVINGVRAQGYYVDMAVGWLIATVESHTEGGGLELMRTARLSPEIKKIAAAKMRDSFRVSAESKREASRIAKG